MGNMLYERVVNFFKNNSTFYISVPSEWVKDIKIDTDKPVTLVLDVSKPTEMRITWKRKI